MDKWTRMLLEMEDMWEASIESRMDYGDAAAYSKERDLYKACRILILYGEEYFLKFVEKCPHIQDDIRDIIPKSCEGPQGPQCNLFCYFYGNGGCTYATE